MFFSYQFEGASRLFSRNPKAFSACVQSHGLLPEISNMAGRITSALKIFCCLKTTSQTPAELCVPLPSATVAYDQQDTPETHGISFPCTSKSTLRYPALLYIRALRFKELRKAVGSESDPVSFALPIVAVIIPCGSSFGM